MFAYCSNKINKLDYVLIFTVYMLLTFITLYMKILNIKHA